MTAADMLTVVFGTVIGFSLGLTGGGGSIFAVPMLMYGLGTGMREAVIISLATVGSTSLMGAALRWRAAELELRGGLVFAIGGLLGAPIGTRIGNALPEALVLIGFALLMGIVGIRMWRSQGGPSPRQTGSCAPGNDHRVHLTLRTIGIVMAAGLVAGVLSGIFGVGGGFIIVPSLIFVTGIPIHRAITTSLLVISVICASGFSSHQLAGEHIPLALTGLFVVGGFMGMLPALQLRSRLSGPGLNRIFAVGMWVVAVFLIVKNTLLAR